MQIPNLVRRFTLIFFIDIYLHMICLSHFVTLTQWPFLIRDTVVCNTPQVNANQLG